MRQRSPLPRAVRGIDAPSPPIREATERARSRRGMEDVREFVRSDPVRIRGGRQRGDPVPRTRVVLRRIARIPVPVPGILPISHRHLRGRGEGIRLVVVVVVVGRREGSRRARRRRHRRAVAEQGRLGDRVGIVLPPSPRGGGDRPVRVVVPHDRAGVSLPRALRIGDALPP